MATGKKVKILTAGLKNLPIQILNADIFGEFIHNRLKLLFK
jgi:hypothetical protein